MRSKFADSRIHFGRPVKFGGGELTPYSRATIVHIPGSTYGVVWSRPGGVYVNRSDGTETELAIRDETRMAQVALLGLGLLGGLAAWLFLKRGK